MERVWSAEKISMTRLSRRTRSWRLTAAILAATERVAAEGVALFAAQGGVPGEHGIDGAPVILHLQFEGVPELAVLGSGGDLAAGEGGEDVLLGAHESDAALFGAGGVGFEQVIADVGAGEVDGGADFFELAGLDEELAEGVLVAGAQMRDDLDGVHAGEGEEEEQDAEAEDERGAGGDEAARIEGRPRGGAGSVTRVRWHAWRWRPGYRRFPGEPHIESNPPDYADSTYGRCAAGGT